MTWTEIVPGLRGRGKLAANPRESARQGQMIEKFFGESAPVVIPGAKKEHFHFPDPLNNVSKSTALWTGSLQANCSHT
jgi:hypothetical protein